MLTKASPHYAGIALWTFKKPEPGSATVEGPSFNDVFARIKARVAEGWALDPAFAPYIQNGKLAGAFLTFTAAFSVVVPMADYRRVLRWVQEYMCSPIHKLTTEAAQLHQQIKRTRMSVRAECAKKQMGFEQVEDITLDRSAKVIARLRAIDTLLHVLPNDTMNVQLPWSVLQDAGEKARAQSLATGLPVWTAVQRPRERATAAWPVRVDPARVSRVR